MGTNKALLLLVLLWVTEPVGWIAAILTPDEPGEDPRVACAVCATELAKPKARLK